MKINSRLLILAGLLFCTVAHTATLDDLGVTLFRAVTTNLDGRGIAVAQPEAPTINSQTWEVNPGSVGRSASIFTYASTNGSTNVYPNNVGVESGHADGVGQTLYGIPNGVATNVMRVDNSEANYFVNTYILGLLPTPPAIGDPIVNQSFTFGPLSVSDQQQVDSGYDDYTAQYGTLFCSAVNNHNESATVCAPGTAYNCIGVGAFTASFNNSIGPTPDNGRCKPDISGEWGDVSTTTAQVSGAAAVLMQAALRGDGGGDTNSAADARTLKALLLNGAVKPTPWTNSTASPLDMRFGAGVFNLFNSYQQLNGGKHGFTVSTTVTTGSAHPPTTAAGSISALGGWDFNTNSSSPINDAIKHYYFSTTNNLNNARFTATLVWNRQQNQSSINNLNLFLYNVANSNLVTCSTSLVDNVEHIYLPQLPPGRYDLQVWKAGGFSTVSLAETYALAWNFALPPTNPPVLSIAKSGANVALSWPILPNGFVVQAATNLNPVINWSTNNIPAPVYTNQQNYILLNATNAAQFFRLFGTNF